MTTLITGATGFIGRHLVERLLRSGVTVRILTRQKKWPHNNQLEGVEVIQGDIRDYQSVVHAVDGVEQVFHLAGDSQPSSYRSLESYYVNITGTKNVLWPS